MSLALTGPGVPDELLQTASNRKTRLHETQTHSRDRASGRPPGRIWLRAKLTGGRCENLTDRCTENVAGCRRKNVPIASHGDVSSNSGDFTRSHNRRVARPHG